MEARQLRRQYLAAVKRYEQAAAEMRAAMEDADAALGVLRAHVEAGRPLLEMLPTVQPAGLRNQLSEAADELERARHAAQRVVYAILLAEGLTMAEIGRTFGVSRSLVSRTIHEVTS